MNLSPSKLDPEARDGFELVERPARVPQPASAHSRTGPAHAATIGPMTIDALSPTPPVECLSTTFLPSAELIGLAARHHGVRQCVGPAAVKLLEEDGHAERAIW